MSVFKYGKTVADFILKYRERNDLTQEQLCEKLGYHTGQQASNIERGTHPCPRAFIQRLVPYLSKEEAEHLIDLFYEEKMDSIEFKFEKVKRRRRA